MSYTEYQIKQYLEILHKYTKSAEEVNVIAKCINCKNSDCFNIHSGCKICVYCGTINGHVLGFYDVNDYDRLYLKKKSIYQRKYHYEKKVNQVTKRLNLTDEEKYELFNKLITIDNHIMKIINKQQCRKRMINIFYSIKKLLEEMGNEKSKLVYLKISQQTLENYEKWWDSYKGLKNKIF